MRLCVCEGGKYDQEVCSTWLPVEQWKPYDQFEQHLKFFFFRFFFKVIVADGLYFLIVCIVKFYPNKYLKQPESIKR